MKSLYWNKALEVVDPAFIIRIKDHSVSEQLAYRCAESCVYAKQPYQFWEAYDGTGETIVQPSHHNDVMSMMKVTDHYLTKSEVACALSHISLWVKCVLLDRPIIILEHDAIMIQPYTSHGVYNSICYLGGVEQALGGWEVKSVPPHATDGPNFHFICRAHAYAIDPIVAKNMVAHVLQMGIYNSADKLLRADLFPIHQMGLYAYDLSSETSIYNRPEPGQRNMIKNDYLEI